MSFPTDFLTDIARKQHLTEKETEAFLCVFGKQGKTMTRQAIADSLHIHKSTLGSRLSGIYKKFSFRDDGPGKENDLRQHLMEQFQTRQATPSEASEDTEPDIDARVREVRNAIQPYIQEKCGTMRVLEMNQPIGLGQIYTHVNILERITGRIGRELADLNGKVDREKFDRFCLGDVREKRVPGLEAVEKYAKLMVQQDPGAGKSTFLKKLAMQCIDSKFQAAQVLFDRFCLENVRERRVPGLEAVEKYAKLMVLGKPGTGKSTFLKHLAMQCIGGKFQAARVPIFVTLKDFADTLGKPDLLTYLDTYLKKGVSLAEVVRGERALVLLDGLDEVREADSSRVLRQIEDISQQFPQNQYIITCRIAAQEYRFESFTEVEIADFDDQQIADFSGKWFDHKNDPVKAERFAQKLTVDQPIRELATNPLLLTLLCLVFEDSGSFPGNRAELYQNGVDVLLKKWDVTRNIERDVVYQKLSLKRKQDLLGNVAYTTFKAGNYFFKQRQVERYISQYIENLPGASTDPEALECDSTAVLKSIEAQHGLFVERARGIYSFSHLTFHEYFTAQKLVTRCNPQAMDDPSLQELVSHITDKRWREVFLLAVGMLDSADVLLQLMKERIDKLLAGDDKLQQFLTWVDEKARSVEAPYKLVAVRAFYLDLSQFFSLSSSIILLQTLGLNLDLSLNFDLSSSISFNFDLDLELGLDLLLSFTLNFSFYQLLSQILDCPILEVELKKVLQALKVQIPDPDVMEAEFQLQWQTNRNIWGEQLRAAMIRYRNIGYDWQFSGQQKELLEQYYEANRLLIDCLNSDCYVSREVRQEIEDTLLLPIAQIEKRRG